MYSEFCGIHNWFALLSFLQNSTNSSYSQKCLSNKCKTAFYNCRNIHSTIFKIHHTYLGLNLPILNEDVDLVNGGKDGDEVGGKVVGENGAKDSSKNGLG